MSRFGEYELLCRLDRAASAPWFAARRRHQPVLLRILEPPEPTWWPVFRRELAAASRLRHPQHLTLLDAGERGGRPFLVYEPAYGLTLDEVDRGPGGLPEAVAAHLGLRLLDGLEALPAHVPLGPVGPSRILATFDGRFLWVDAGLPSTSPSLPDPRRATAGPPETRPEAPPGVGLRYALGRLLSDVGPILDPERSDATVDWFRALAPLVATEPAAGSAPDARTRLEALADAVRAERWLRDRHRRLAVRVHAAFERDGTADERATVPPPDRAADQGSGPVAGAIERERFGDFTLVERVPSASPIPLYVAFTATRPCWLRHHPASPGDWPARDASFHRERQLAAVLSHPALPRPLEEGPAHIAYARPHCRPLLARLRDDGENPLAWSAIALQLTDLLEHLHDRGLVAANIQPASLGVDDSGSVLLVDRSFVAHPDALDPWLKDNLHALAPEFLVGGTYGAASDRFALGALLYAMITGTPPYRGLAPEDLTKAMERGRARPVRSLAPSLAPEAAALVDALLEPEPEARPPLRSVRRVLEALTSAHPGVNPTR